MIIYKYFDDGKWIDFELGTLTELSSHKTIWREEVIIGEYRQKTYYLGDKIHRLDGPAISKKTFMELKTEWYVEGIYLRYFEEFYNENNPQQSVFDYIKRYKMDSEFFVALRNLVVHNNWLDKEQLLAFDCLTLFKC